MHVTLMPFSGEYAQALASLCQAADRTYLSGRLPSPYTLRDAQAFICHVSEEDGKAGLFRAIVMDGALVGNISVERKSGISCRDVEIGYLLHPRCASQGIMTQAVGQMCALAFARFDLLRRLVKNGRRFVFCVLCQLPAEPQHQQPKAHHKQGEAYKTAPEQIGYLLVVHRAEKAPKAHNGKCESSEGEQRSEYFQDQFVARMFVFVFFHGQMSP